MALIRSGLTIDTIRGKMGNASFRVRRGSGRVGLSGGRRPAPTVAQLEYRESFGLAARAWSALTDSERDDWNTWADLYGTTADPNAPTEASGYQRWLGAHTMQTLAGLPIIQTPSLDGIGNAEPALIAFFPREGTALADVEMLLSYNTPALQTAAANLYATNSQPQSSPSNKKRYAQIDSFDVTNGGPGDSEPVLVVDLREEINRGQTMWIETRVIVSAGNTSRRAPWPIILPASDELRAFRIAPVFEIFAPSRYFITGNELTIQSSGVDDFDLEIVYDLTAAPVDTLAELFAKINSDGLWRAVNQNADTMTDASVELVDTTPTHVTTRQQPALLRIPE